jgi:hypothetical protein
MIETQQPGVECATASAAMQGWVSRPRSAKGAPSTTFTQPTFRLAGHQLLLQLPAVLRTPELSEIRAHRAGCRPVLALLLGQSLPPSAQPVHALPQGGTQLPSLQVFLAILNEALDRSN